MMLFALIVAFIATTFVFGELNATEKTIDMHTDLYHVPDLYMPAVHALDRKYLISKAVKEFNIHSYMSVRSI